LLIDQFIARSKRAPALVVLNHASFHASRNRLTALQRKRWASTFRTGEGAASEVLSTARFPQAKTTHPLSTASDLAALPRIPMADFYHPGFLVRHSALAHLIEEAALGIADRRSDKEEVTYRLIDALIRRTEYAGGRVLITALQGDEPTRSALVYAAAHGADTLDYRVDLRDADYNNLPWDGHPNAKAHARYAACVLQYLESFSEASPIMK
jgi:hypothetical protein